MKKRKARNSKTLSVVSLLPYFCSNFPDCEMVPAVVYSSFLVPSTLCDDNANVSKVDALFCVVSDRCLEMESIFSVTLSCCPTKPVLLCLLAPAVLCLISFSPVIDISSSLLAFSISSIEVIFALRNDCNVFEN